MDGNLRKLFHSNLGGFHFQAIETGMTGRGIPDSNYCYKGKEGWVEFKQTKHWRVGIWPEQVAWIERRTRAGGRAFVAVRRAEKELWILAPGAARLLKDPGLKGVPDKLVLGWWDNGPSSWDWDAVAKILTKRVYK